MHRITSVGLAIVLGLLVSNRAPAEDPTKPDQRTKLMDRLVGLPADLARCKPGDDVLVDAAYNTVLARTPKPNEKVTAVKFIGEKGNREGRCQDLVWALMNTKEFMQVHDFATFAELQVFSEAVVKKWERK